MNKIVRFLESIPEPAGKIFYYSSLAVALIIGWVAIYLGNP